jgi:hypothetical protein
LQFGFGWFRGEDFKVVSITIGEHIARDWVLFDVTVGKASIYLYWYGE